MTTYADRLAPYANFKNKTEMDEQVTMHLQHIGYKLNKTDHRVLNHLKTHAVRYPGAFQQLLETIAEAVDKSVPTVKRILTKLVGLGIIARKKTRKKNNSRAGATIYQFQFFSPVNEPKKVIPCNNKKDSSNHCESKVEEIASEHKPFISLNKSFKDTNITDVPDKNKSLKIGLLNKVPQVIANAISPFMDDADEIFEMVGTIFNAKKKVDKSIQIEAHEDEYYKAIVSVFESQKRAARKEKPFNVFAVMYRAIEKLTKSIVCPESKTAPQVTPDDAIKPLKTKELIQQWMIDAETDPTRKAQLQATKDLQEQQSLITRSKERVPDWMLKRSGATVQVPQSNSVDDDAAFFEQAQKAFRERLATS